MSDRSSYPPRVSGHPPEPPQPPDLALARRIVEGDRDALAHAYREHANSALRTAMRFLRSTPDAEDAVHNVFQSLPKTLRTYQGRGNLRGWICKATSRAALMILRRRRRLSEVSLAAASAEQRATPVGDPETKIMLERAIQDLPERFRLVYLLKDVEGFSHADVASLLDMTEEASRVRLHRARKYLRGRMQ